MVRQQVLRARKYKKTELFYSHREEFHKKKVAREHSKVFENIPIIGFKKGKSLMEI